MLSANDVDIRFSWSYKVSVARLQQTVLLLKTDRTSSPVCTCSTTMQQTEFVLLLALLVTATTMTAASDEMVRPSVHATSYVDTSTLLETYANGFN